MPSSLKVIISADWDNSFIINLYKGKGDATDRGNCRGLNMTEYCLKVIERVLDKVLRDIATRGA